MRSMETALPQREQTDTNRVESLALLTAHSEDLRDVSQAISGDMRFLTDSRPPQTPADVCAMTQFLRLDAWMRTLSKLTEPVCLEPMHFQAAASGARAVLELAVDLVLLATDPKGAEKLHDWEWSAKERQAAALKRYYEKSGGTAREEDAFVMKRGSELTKQTEALRLKHGWVDKKTGKPRHPPRWTDRNLDADCIEADKWAFRGTFSFEEHYERRYRPTCWAVHGSAFVGRHSQEDVFPFEPARYLWEASDLALLGARACFQRLGLLTSDIHGKFERFEQTRKRKQNEGFLRIRNASLASP